MSDRPAEIGAAAVDRLHEEDRAVERVELEVAEVLAEYGDVEHHVALSVLHSELIGVDLLRLELEILGPEAPGGGLARIGRREDRVAERRAVEVEAAR